MDYQVIWFILITVLFTGFFFLEGFDYGVGMLFPFVSKREEDRSLILRTIGPVWDGNEVWMITAGGALFAAFPHVYATMFSAFYLALFLMLAALILRGVAFELRTKEQCACWQKMWDAAIFIGSIVPAFLWGVAVTDLAAGLPIGENMVYQGNFKQSMYEDQGTQYYQDGTLYYTGGFHENLHSGTGSIYRPDGSLEYEGGFAIDKKEGEGTLYDYGHNQIFTGQFTQDDIKYSDLIGKSAAQVAQSYTGERTLYQSSEERVRFMPDIDAMTVEYLDEDSIDADAKVESVFVLRNTFNTADGPVSTFREITEVLGQPIYVGTSYGTLPELLTINKLIRSSDAPIFDGEADVDISSVFTEYSEISDYDEEYEVYLRTYHKGGLEYVFVTEQGLDTFYFYYIITEDLSDIE